MDDLLRLLALLLLPVLAVLLRQRPGRRGADPAREGEPRS